MGLSISALINQWLGQQKARILCVGLDAAGKTTILYRLKLGEVVTTIPTLGFNVETVKFNNISFTVWDLGGQERIRRLWRHYFEETDGLIFVIDSADRHRLAEAAVSFNGVMSEEALRDASILIYANKQDLPNAASLSEIAEALGLNRIRQKNWHVQACTATSGDGIVEGLEWMSKAVANK